LRVALKRCTKRNLAEKAGEKRQWQKVAKTFNYWNKLQVKVCIPFQSHPLLKTRIPQNGACIPDKG
jgi:hypothetical protein